MRYIKWCFSAGCSETSELLRHLLQCSLIEHNNNGFNSNREISNRFAESFLSQTSEITIRWTYFIHYGEPYTNTGLTCEPLHNCGEHSYDIQANGAIDIVFNMFNMLQRWQLHIRTDYNINILLQLNECKDEYLSQFCWTATKICANLPPFTKSIFFENKQQIYGGCVAYICHL